MYNLHMCHITGDFLKSWAAHAAKARTFSTFAEQSQKYSMKPTKQHLKHMAAPEMGPHIDP